MWRVSGTCVRKLNTVRYKKNMFALLGRQGYEELTKELTARLNK
jgi:hypothetical protein